MLARVLFLVIALFWIVMNALLWRTEFGGGKETGSAVSEEVVWQKILTAPDDSMLEISVNGKKVGYCRWTPNVGEEAAVGNMFRDDFQPDGRVRQPAGYTIDLEGNVLAGQSTARARFNTRVRFAANQAWEEMSLRLSLRPALWEVRTASAEKELTLKYQDGEEAWSRTFTYEELRNPRNLIEEFGGPLAVAAIGPFSGLDTTSAGRNLSLGLKWEARNDSLKIGHSLVRVYRLQARLFDRYQAVVIVSRVGEIMRVELPNGIRLVNEALTAL